MPQACEHVGVGSHEIMRPDPTTRVELYWIPLGAGGTGFVRLNGRIYERFLAWRERREPCDLYHTALVVHLPEGRTVVETMWPSPDRDTSSRGVVFEGAVGLKALARWRTFRYEVRVWREGLLPDADQAMGGPRLVGSDEGQARLLLDSARALPPLMWGRDQLGTGDMWNSNSVISWLLVRAGITIDDVCAPEGGRAPGWKAGIVAAADRSLGVEPTN